MSATFPFHGNDAYICVFCYVWHVLPYFYILFNDNGFVHVTDTPYAFPIPVWPSKLRHLTFVSVWSPFQESILGG